MKAVILSGNKQYTVAEGDQVLIDRIDGDKKELTFDPLMIIDGAKTKVGTPTVKDVKVTAKIVEELVKGEKVRAIRFEAKKRVNKVSGQRHQYTKIEITSIK
ncbi:50S ribosomal protein L21 [Candidatus Saccharibacteria bacterium]|nr:50S ribosomal protein L21 [Candidatus Saccharibacteria bacterium]MCL1962791.1 50S ribosomal protein L21 [Candidatus Saccharibacteria bacterium]